MSGKGRHPWTLGFEICVRQTIRGYLQMTLQTWTTNCHTMDGVIIYPLNAPKKSDVTYGQPLSFESFKYYWTPHVYCVTNINSNNLSSEAGWDGWANAGAVFLLTSGPQTICCWFCRELSRQVPPPQIAGKESWVQFQEETGGLHLDLLSLFST